MTRYSGRKGAGIRQRIPEWRRRLQRPCQWREGEGVESSGWEDGSGLRPSVEKNNWFHGSSFM